MTARRDAGTSGLAAPPLPAYPGIFVVAMATLLLELALTRIFAVMLWSHLAFMIVGTALFGYGLSGVTLSMVRRLRSYDPLGLVAGSCLGFSLGTLVLHLVLRTVPFRMWNFRDEPEQWLYLALWYLAVLLPFFFSGLAVATLLSTFPRHVNRLYGNDLVGAGIGCLLLVPLIPILGGEGLVFLAATLGGVATVIHAVGSGHRRLAAAGCAATVVFGLLTPAAGDLLPLVVHQKKRLFEWEEQVSDLIYTRWSAISRVDVRRIDDDHYKIWIDAGANETHMRRFDGDWEGLEPLTGGTQCIPHAFQRGTDPRVLVVGPGGGREVMFAVSHGASHVDAVDMDPSVVRVVSEVYDEFLGGLYRQPHVHLHNDEGRSFLSRQNRRYDIIQQVQNFSPAAIATGALNLSESFLITRESFRLFLRHLTEDGVLAMERPYTERLGLLARTALEDVGKAEPLRHLLLYRGDEPYHDGIMVKNSPWTEPEVDRVAETMARWDLPFFFDPTGRYPEAGLHREVLESDDVKAMERRLRINLSVPTDDRPFMNHAVPWTLGPRPLHEELGKELHDANHSRWKGSIPRGDFPMVVILVESVLLASFFVMLPLWVFRRRGLVVAGRLRLLAYFAALGAGFILVEICLMKKYVLFLGYPVYSITTVLVTLLVATGIGSWLSERLGGEPRDAIRKVLPWVAGVLLLELVLSALILEPLLGQPLWLRVGVTMALLTPIGLVLGMPFPLGLKLCALQGETGSDLVAWAWGVNGYTTVIGSSASVFLALGAGFRLTFLLALAIYVAGLGGVAFSRRFGGAAAS